MQKHTGRSGSMGSQESKMSSQIQDIMVTHREETREPLLRECLVAEFVGTFFLVFTVGMAVASGGAAPIAIGLVLAVQIYTFGAVSGAFLNPAVTIAVLCSGRNKISLPHAGLYILAQMFGGLVAGLLAYAGNDKSFCFLVSDYRKWGTCFELEVLCTMALCGIVLAAGTSNDAPNQYFGFAIGCTVMGCAIACGGFDQGSFNPAVTFGMNIANYANGDNEVNPSVGDWLLYLLAPVFGGILAAGVFRLTRSNEYLACEVAAVDGGKVDQALASTDVTV